MNLANELRLGHTLGQRLLRGYASDQTGLGMWQKIIGGYAKQAQWLSDNIELQIGANTSELHRAVTTWIGAEGFIIVPIKTGRCGLLIVAHAVLFIY